MTNEDTMATIDIDKLTESYSLKIPEILKVRLSSLTLPEKKKLNLKLMEIMARAAHEHSFKLEDYLTSSGG